MRIAVRIMERMNVTNTPTSAPPAGGLTIQTTPRPPARGIIVRTLEKFGEVEILVFEQDIADLEVRLDRIRAGLGAYAECSGRRVMIWPVGHPERTTGYVVSGLAPVEVVSSLAALPGVTWSPATPAVTVGRW